MSVNQHEEDSLFEKTLDESKALLESASRVAEADYAFTLEAILAEYGEPEATPSTQEEKPSLPLVEKEMENPAESMEAGRDSVAPPVDPPQIDNLRQVLARTVQNVLDERKDEPVLDEKPKRRALFSRREYPDTESLYDNSVPDGEHIRQSTEETTEFEPPEAPDPPIEETVAGYRGALQRARRATRFTAFFTLLMWVPTLLERFGWMPAFYLESRWLRTVPFFTVLALICLLGREVFASAVKALTARKVTYALLTVFLCVAALGDTALSLFCEARALGAAQPLYAVAALSMTCALYGRLLLDRALYDTFRVAALGEAPYLVTTTAGGAAKRHGSMNGFSAVAQRGDVSSRWQEALLPLILMGALVFSVLATIQGGSWALWCWNLSAILAGGNALAFPLVYALPLRRVTRRFTESGGALAGYNGAAEMCRSNCLVLTDSDLFPPGTVTLNGLRIFGEESSKVFSYAATMVRASGAGVARLFEQLLAQECGKTEIVTDLNFYEEGGVGGTIHGETVFFGTAAFCRKMSVALPKDLKLRTGLFLAIDGRLSAIFAVKYRAAEKVDWALRALARARITPVLAVRDPNITLTLLKRKFGTDARAVYPRLSTRLALSEREGSKPCALLYREGLAPYAELAVGAKRLHRSVCAGNALSIAASVSGTLLTFYLSFLGAYDLFTPFKLAVFLLLWALAALVEGCFVDKY